MERRVNLVVIVFFVYCILTLTQSMWEANAADVEELQMELDDLKNRDPSIRGRAAVALGRRGDPCAVKSLINALKDADSEVRCWTCYALAMVAQKTDPSKIVDAVPQLITALKDKSPKVRDSAASALGASRDKRAIEPLKALLKDNDSDVRRAAENAISEIKGESRTLRF